MLSFVFRKMLNTPWMVLCLLVGSTLAVAVVAGVPTYTDGVLQRMLVRDLELFQEASYRFPGRYNLEVEFLASRYDEKDTSREMYSVLDDLMSPQQIRRIVDLPVLSRTKGFVRDYLNAEPDIQREEDPISRPAALEALEGLKDHVSILHGRMFDSRMSGNTAEVIVTEQAMQKLDLLLGEAYRLSDIMEEADLPFHVKIVGVFTLKDKRDPFWFQAIHHYRSSFFMDYDLFQSFFVRGEMPVYFTVIWDYAFDYHELSMDACSRIIEAYEEQRQYLRSFYMARLTVPAIPILEEYQGRQKQLRTTLWVLQVPVLLMLAFYVFMVSRLLVDHEKTDIAVLKSRGSSSRQIFLGYFLEGLLLSLAALVAGPPLGYLFCKFIGTTDGFFQFVQRSALPLRLEGNAYFYAFGAVLLFMLAMLLPAYLASRTTIVLYKAEKSREPKKPLWQMIGLDALLFALSGYGLFQFFKRQEVLEISGIGAAELSLDPLLYLISTLFILGCGMLFLILFPYLVRLLYWIGRRVWPPVLYNSLVQVGRAGSYDQFLMLFLILTLSLGVYNASAARTLNANAEEKVRYFHGADITLTAYWESNRENETALFDAGSVGMPGSPSSVPFSEDPPIYIEPPFQPFTELVGIEMATKVLRRKKVNVQIPGGGWARNVEFMAVIPHEFGRIAWFRTDLLPYHWFEYLNLLSRDPQAVLLSSSFREEVELGQSIWFSWENQSYLEGKVYGFIDYWPTFNPKGSGSSSSRSKLLVANLTYAHAKMAMEPYEVWLKKEPGAGSEEVYRDIEAKDLRVESLRDADQEIIRRRNDPMLQGTNGVLTLSFMVTLGISIIGFLIYWIISIQERLLQFGVLRAIGMSTSKVIAMLLCEHTLVSGVPILMGISIGGVASRLFVPLLQVVYSAAQQVPPFQVVAAAGDYAKIYGVVAFMLAAGLTILGIITSRIQIHQAVKLGEE